MKKSFLFVFILYAINLFSQQQEQPLVPMLDGTKYGYSTVEKKIVIPAKYDFACPFFPGYALTMVVVDGKPFMINRKGKKVFEGSFDYLKRMDFNNYPNWLSAKTSSIDLQKNCLVDTCPTYSVTPKLINGNVFDKLGTLYSVSDSKKIMLIDEKGKLKSELFDRIRHIGFGEYEYCITEDSTMHKKGLLDKNGKVLLNCTYDDIIYKGAGVFVITDSNVSHDFKVVLENKNQEEAIKDNVVKDTGLQIKRKNAKTGVVDSDGNILISYTYDRLYPINGNKFLFLKGNQTGIINAKEEFIFVDTIPINKNQISGRQPAAPYFPFTDSLFFFNFDKWILIDINGNRIEQKFDCMYVDYQKLVPGFAGVCMNGKIGVVNKNANLTIPAVYDEIICLSGNSSFLARTNKQWTWFNSAGQTIYTGIDAFLYILNNHLLVLKAGKWYFVDGEGKAFLKG